MWSQHAQELACSLIRAHFGEIVQKVCQCIMVKGQVTLQEIVRYTKLSSLEIRNCLLVLIQHNCVQAFRVAIESGANVRTFTKYIALIDKILHRLRFPKFLHVVVQELGEEAEQLVLGFLEHGRLTLEQLIQRAAGRASKAESEVADSVKEKFASIACARLVERCPASEPLLLPKSVTDPPKKAGRGAGRGRAVLAVDHQLESEEHRICAAAGPLDAERFRLPESLGGPVLPSNDPEGGAGVGQKRKRDALTMDSRTLALVDEKEVLWRVNCEEFVRRFRLQACAAQVRSRLDSGAATVFAAMLELLNQQETACATQKVSAILSTEAILNAVRSSPEGQVMSMERIRGALQMMAAESVGFLTRLGDGRYSINFSKIIDVARKVELEGIVLQRFGRESCRIFRLLAMKGHLEQKQIADSTLLLAKDARDRLYKLYKEEYVSLQEVPKTADRAPSKTIFLWHVNFRMLFKRVLDDMCHAAFNILKRLTYELEQEREVLELARRQQLAAQSAGATQLHVSQSQRDRANRIKRVALALESSLMKLDDSILCFNDF